MDQDLDFYDSFTDHSSYCVKLPETGIEANVTVSTIHNQDNLGAEEFQRVAYGFSEELTEELEYFCREEAPLGDYDICPIIGGNYNAEPSMKALIPVNDKDSEFPGLEAKREGELILSELDEYLSKIS